MFYSHPTGYTLVTKKISLPIQINHFNCAPAGDISFRFLDYVRSQRERVARRTARANQTPSWQEISTSYTTPTEGIEMETEARESRAVVCDINKEMLKVGKQKAESMGISSGREI